MKSIVTILFLNLLFSGSLISLFAKDFNKHYKANKSESGADMYTTTGFQTKAYICEVRAVAFSTDGKYLASGNHDNTITIWDIETGKDIRTLKSSSDNEKSGVNSVVFSPDGKYIAGGFEDATISLWETASGIVLRTFNGHKFPVISIAFSPDGKYLASGSFDNTSRLWDAETGKRLKTFGESEDYSIEAVYVSFSPDGKYLYSGSTDGRIQCWNTKTGEEMESFNVNGEELFTIAFSPDGKYTASGSLFGEIKLWKTESGDEKKTISKSKEDYYKSLGVKIKKPFYDYQTGKGGYVYVTEYPDLYLWIECLAFSPDGRYIASAVMHDSSIRLFDTKTNVTKNLQNSNFIYSLAFSHDGRYLAGGNDGSVGLWEIESGKYVRTFANTVYSDNNCKYLSRLQTQKVKHIVMWSH